jgi:hypothetical protein
MGEIGSSMRTCLYSTVPPPPREGRGGTFRDDEICLVRHCRERGGAKGMVLGGDGLEKGNEKGGGGCCVCVCVCVCVWQSARSGDTTRSVLSVGVAA